MKRIDLHTHSLLSDGELVPSELARRAEKLGHAAIAITDHVDLSNIESVVPQIAKVVAELNRHMDIRVIAGAELTHVPVKTMAKLAKLARKLGAELVLAHGETIVEPVHAGTNDASLAADIDILAHPGLLTLEQAERA
jgi:histidinol phosphatase-like PHP family hydrolase